LRPHDARKESAWASRSIHSCSDWAQGKPSASTTRARCGWLHAELSRGRPGLHGREYRRRHVVGLFTGTGRRRLHRGFWAGLVGGYLTARVVMASKTRRGRRITADPLQGETCPPFFFRDPTPWTRVVLTSIILKLDVVDATWRRSTLTERFRPMGRGPTASTAWRDHARPVRRQPTPTVRTSPTACAMGRRTGQHIAKREAWSVCPRPTRSCLGLR